MDRRGKTRTARGREVRRAIAIGLAMGLMLAGCAGRQAIPLDLSPREAEVFVDGKKIDADSKEVKLRVDRDHKIFVKKKGFRSELVVIRSVEVEGEQMLSPSEVEVQLDPLTRTRMDVEIGIEAEEPAAPE